MFPSDILATWKLTFVLLDEASWPCNKSNPFFESICISTQLFTAIYFTFMFVSTKLLASNEHVTREDFSGFKDFLNFCSNIVSFVSFRPVLFLAPFALCPAACLTNKGYEGLKQMFNITLIQNCICSPQNTWCMLANGSTNSEMFGFKWWRYLRDISGVSTPPLLEMMVGVNWSHWRPTLGSGRGRGQEGGEERRGLRGGWRPRWWCPRRRGTPPGGQRGCCRGSNTSRRGQRPGSRWWRRWSTTSTRSSCRTTGRAGRQAAADRGRCQRTWEIKV